MVVSGDVVELEHVLALEVKMRDPEPVWQWPRRAPRGAL